MEAIGASGIDVSSALTPIESLNKLLNRKDLYKIMKKRPKKAEHLIKRLEEDDLAPLEVIRLNRFLLEANYPLETPNSHRKY